MRRLYIGGLAALLLEGFGAASTAAAAPVVTRAAGPNAAAITPAVNEFGNDLGTLNGGGPPAPSGRRQIVWDGVPADRQSPAFMPENQFRNVGALFATPTLGAAFQVSGVNDFANLNATYATAFDAFSPPRVFAPIGEHEHRHNLRCAGIGQGGRDERVRRRLQRRGLGRFELD